MSKLDLINIRKWVAVVCIAWTAGILWGFVLTGIFKFGFGFDSPNLLFYVGIPTALIVIVVLWRRLPKILGF
jgi:hypothetical protein